MSQKTSLSNHLQSKTDDLQKEMPMKWVCHFIYRKNKMLLLVTLSSLNIFATHKHVFVDFAAVSTKTNWTLREVVTLLWQHWDSEIHLDRSHTIVEDHWSIGDTFWRRLIATRKRDRLHGSSSANTTLPPIQTVPHAVLFKSSMLGQAISKSMKGKILERMKVRVTFLRQKAFGSNFVVTH